MRLYFIRHAQSVNNAFWETHGNSSGHVPDAELSDLGHQQAAHLAAYLERSDFGITHFYTSPMTRAIQTALPCAKALGLPLHVMPDWFEIGGVMGRNEAGERVPAPGADRASFQTRFPELHLPDGWAEHGWWQSKPRETDEQFVQRCQRAWTGLLERHGNTSDRVAIVSHGKFHAGFMATVLEVSLDRFVLVAANTGITCMDYREDGWEHVMVSFTNRVAHLPPELLTK